MRFWDASAIVPLFLKQPATRRSTELFRADDELAVWWATSTECWSAFGRLRRQAIISSEEEDRADADLETLQAVWYEVSPSEEVRRHARRILRTHPLRASDALQLAAAIVWVGHTGEGEFVSFDERLRGAARLEGFTLV